MNKQLILLILLVTVSTKYEGSSSNRIQRSRPSISRTLTVYSHLFISLDNFSCVAQASQENTMNRNLASNTIHLPQPPKYKVLDVHPALLACNFLVRIHLPHSFFFSEIFDKWA